MAYLQIAIDKTAGPEEREAWGWLRRRGAAPPRRQRQDRERHNGDIDMKLLVSVRSVEEALLAAEGGADFIDLKEPGAGALGGLPIATIRAIVDALRRQGRGLPVSATIGDVPMHDVDAHRGVRGGGRRVRRRLRQGRHRARAAGARGARRARTQRPRRSCRCSSPTRASMRPHVAHACALGFPGVMADTADKHAGSLFDVLSMDELRRFVATVRGAGAMVGLAGALRVKHQAAVEAAGARLRRLSHGSVRRRPQLGARPASPAGLDPADAGPGARRSGAVTGLDSRARYAVSYPR